jgi:hypothetical protein
VGGEGGEGTGGSNKDGLRLITTGRGGAPRSNEEPQRRREGRRIKKRGREGGKPRTKERPREAQGWAPRTNEGPRGRGAENKVKAAEAQGGRLERCR